MNRIVKRLKEAGIDSFLVLLIGMVMLAYILPLPGTISGLLSLKTIADVGIFAIFFFYGLRLSPEKMRAGLGNTKLHIVIHMSTFILFPAIAFSVRHFFKGTDNELLWLGIFYLAALPSTVSSSVVMVSIAQGNIPAAVFNASLSSLIGVFITPLLMSMVMNTSGDIDMGELSAMIGKLVIQVIIPIVAGMLLNKKWGAAAEKRKTTLRKFDQAVILLVVYISFCQSFASNIFKGFGVWKIIWCSAGMVILFFAVYSIISIVCKALKFNKTDTITATFCGSKKSLVHGTAMSKVLFSGTASAGIILLPIMLYHALQLIIVSSIAQRIAKQK